MLALRQHQLECLDAIDKHFAAENNRGLVKMFCGAGKSLVIYNALIKHGADLAVVVVPSINLITQFNTDYLIKFEDHSGHDYTTLTICSKDEIATKGVEFTTEPDDILEFLESSEDNDSHKIILVTYQSLETLFNVVEEYEYTIDLICFDEAHHIVADGVQELLFGDSTDEYSDERYGFIDSNIERALFFTATPINKNGICMFNLDSHITIGDTEYEYVDTLDVNECSSEEPHCGDMIYEYMHIDGVNDNVLNDFDIRVDLYTDEGDISIFEAIARTILETGNSRVLTFHSRSETASEKSSDVVSFYNESNKKLFKKAFGQVVANEFPEKKDFYKKITLTGITGNTKNRTKILEVFDMSPDDQIYLLGSCETIGEGVDTKNANMCVFVDPKQSYVKIIQNIGRICRKQTIRRNGTVLIPARVNVEKYKSCDDPVARDKVIREEMSRTGDFNGILNCLSALRQEDPYMFELCLKYPDVFTKKELRDNFRKNGLVLDDKEYSGPELFEDLGTEYKGGVSEKANFNMLSRKLGTNIQVSNQKILEEDMYIDRGCDKTTHFVKTDSDKYMKATTDTTDKTGSTSGCSKINRPHRNAKPFVHANSDIQVLWKFSSDLDVSKSVFGGYIQADVIVDNEEKWSERLEEVKKYMDDNGKRPGIKDIGKTETSLGDWFNRQIKNYKNNKDIMKQLKIKQAWFNFINDDKYKQYFKSKIEEWYNTLAEVKTYMDIYNKRPSDRDKVQNIKSLSNWIYTQFQQYKQNKYIMKLQPAIKQAWENFTGDPKYSKYFTSNIEEWYNTLAEVKTYMDTYNKRPNKSDKSLNIKKMGNWISSQLHNYKQNKNIMKLQPAIKQVWENFTIEPKYKQYFISIDTEWYNTLAEVKIYMDTYNKRPNTRDNNKIIKKMGNWISCQIQNYKQNKYIMKIPEIRQAWLEFTSDPKYSQYFTNNDTEWYNTLAEVKTYMDTYNKRPSDKDKGQNIKKMAKWISHQLTNYKQNKNIMKILEIRQVWEEFTCDAKYSQYFTSNEQEWYNTLEEVKTYIDINNKLPGQHDNNQNIKKMGSWISVQIQNYKHNKNITVHPDIINIWEDFTSDPKYTKYFTSNDEEWYNTLAEVKKYIEIYNKRPSDIDKDQNIKKMGNWIGTQLKNYKQNKNIMVQPEIKRTWEKFTSDPKYTQNFTSNDEEWYNTLEDVKNYIDIYNKRPNTRNKDQNIKKMGSWISNQLNKYKQNKQIMKQLNIKQAWEDFIADPKYAPYFTAKTEDNPKIKTISESTEPKEPKPAPKSTVIKLKIKTIDNPVETEPQRQQRKQSEYQELTKKMATQKSENTNKMFIQTPSLWHEYHDCRDFSFKGYDKQEEISLNKIIKYLETKKNHKLKILDLGCGRNLIQEHFKDNKKFTITGYDYVSYNGSKVADISSLPEADESVKVCVYSQSLMGSNWKDYLLEGYRVLEYNGEMIISESVERYEVVKEQLEAIGMHVIREEYAETNRWFYIYAIKQ